MYTNVKSLCYTRETNIVCQLYTSVKKQVLVWIKTGSAHSKMGMVMVVDDGGVRGNGISYEFCTFCNAVFITI